MRNIHENISSLTHFFLVSHSAYKYFAAFLYNRLFRRYEMSIVNFQHEKKKKKILPHPTISGSQQCLDDEWTSKTKHVNVATSYCCLPARNMPLPTKTMAYEMHGFPILVYADSLNQMVIGLRSGPCGPLRSRYAAFNIIYCRMCYVFEKKILYFGMVSQV